MRCPAAATPSPNITWMKDGRPFERRIVGQVSRHLPVLYHPCVSNNVVYVLFYNLKQLELMSIISVTQYPENRGMFTSTAVSCENTLFPLPWKAQ